MRRTRSVYIKLVLTTFFWGGTFVAGKWAVGEAPPFFVAFLRPVFGVLLSALILSEKMKVSQLAGGILVVVGVGIGTLGGQADRDGASG